MSNDYSFITTLKYEKGKVFVSVTSLLDSLSGVLKWGTLLDYPFVHGFSLKSENYRMCKYLGPQIKRKFDNNSLEWFDVGEEKKYVYNLVDIIYNFDILSFESYTISSSNEMYKIVFKDYSKDDEFPEFIDAKTKLNEVVLNSNIIDISKNEVEDKKKEFLISRPNINYGDKDKESSHSPCSPGICYGGHYQEYEFLGGGGSARCMYNYYPVKVNISQARQDIINNSLKPINNIYFKHELYKNIKNDNLYKKWFGVYNNENVAIVKANLQVLNLMHACSTFTFHDKLQCAPDVYGYFWKNQNYNGQPCGTNHICNVIQLCTLFWNSNLTGWNSKPGILVHELTHSSGGTEDLCYGILHAQALAKNDSSKAVKNADNYEYYIEELIG